MKSRKSWFIRLEDDSLPGMEGIGECGPLPGLSTDNIPEFEAVLGKCLETLVDHALPSPGKVEDIVACTVPEGFPSIRLGLETALLDLVHGGRRIVFRNGFIQGIPIPINGLVWMGDRKFMIDQIRSLIQKGFTCIKLKVGGLDFETECDILRGLRNEFDEQRITLRLDANGAFSIEDAPDKLSQLSQFSIHSIEQPVKAGADEMRDLCRRSPVPIALDEELIGKEREKAALLERIRPAFIVLKPTLHGGFRHCAEWIDEARRLGIGWWITSALESNIGLNAISQFAAGYEPGIHQGLGTGSIYRNNFESPLKVFRGQLVSDPTGTWELDY